MENITETVNGYLQSEITAKASFPGAQYAIGEDHQIVAEGALGDAVVDPEAIPANLDTIYDLASLTKPLITALLVVKLAERGVLKLDAPVGRYLSEFNGTRGSEISLTRLLTHTSGIPNWRPLYLQAHSRDEAPAAIVRIVNEPHSPPPGTEVIYSDLNYILLGFVLERITGQSLDHLAGDEIIKPLSLKRTMFNPPAEIRREIAATEHGQTFELANAVADAIARRRLMGLDTPARFAAQDNETSLSELALADPQGASSSISQYRWRKDVIWGEVHDGNAHFMGGVAGHAGLFSTAREVFRIANQFLPGSNLLRPESLKLFTDNLTPGCATSRSIAWILARTPDCSAGPALLPDGIGHNGFTGTSVWMKPDRRRVLVLLTNRVHPRVNAIDIREIRRSFNTIGLKTVFGS